MTTITVPREVLERALEALEQCGLTDSHRSYEFEHAARAALRAALAQQEQDWKALYDAQVRLTDAAMWRAESAQRMLDAALAQQEQEPEPVAWTDRELELIDGMIEVQLHHAAQCDGIANRTMAEKQKGWDMERVALLQKIKSNPPRRETEQEQAEPVLVVEKEPDYMSRGHFYEGSKPFIDPTEVWKLPIGTKLYTHLRREWQGLTEEEREQATGWSVEHIEATLKEKNT